MNVIFKILLSMLILLQGFVVFAQKTVYSSPQLYKNSANSVVSILADNKLIGTGFYVHPNVIFTSNKIEPYAEVKCITADMDTIKVVSLRTQDEMGLSLLFVRDKREPLKLSNKEPFVGEDIYIIGRSVGLEPYIADGMITLKKKTHGISLFHITAPILPKNNGSPVVNEYGQVVGIALGRHHAEGDNNLAMNSLPLPDLIDSMLNLAEEDKNRSEPRKPNLFDVLDGKSSRRVDFSCTFITEKAPNDGYLEKYVEEENTFVLNANERGDIIWYKNNGEIVQYKKHVELERTTAGGDDSRMFAFISEENERVLFSIYSKGAMLIYEKEVIRVYLLSCDSKFTWKP